MEKEVKCPWCIFKIKVGNHAAGDRVCCTLCDNFFTLRMIECPACGDSNWVAAEHEHVDAGKRCQCGCRLIDSKGHVLVLDHV
ncbi:hypothetical protein [Thalassolituus marinus]|uniref:Uncharacterized protein n=1 Tax=Thalassolituus marinus TaxID=671053 RepID=A0ABS7ZW52_9GAMM|nr:hypothetical protein [Thalassolituus marinus]MCA6065448.1 hypothetical protein [Thalassolituus marinus]